MPNELWIAGAGSGKTHKIITESVEAVRRGERVLVVTYTTNNQAELRAHFVEHYGSLSENFVVKGLFTFYLEDLVRPYQQIFSATAYQLSFSPKRIRMRLPTRATGSKTGARHEMTVRSTR